jgi:hypothetical protein
MIDPYYQRILDPKRFRDKQWARAQSFRTDSPTSFVEKGVEYTLTPDWDQKRKIEARMSPDALARQKAVEARTGQIENLSFGYVSPSGKRFSGTFLGDGNYGGVGRELGFGSDEYQARVQNRKAVREGQRQSRKTARQAEREAPKEAPQEQELPPAPKGYVYNRFGYLEPEGWYDKDEKTGDLTKKTERQFLESKNAKFPKMPTQDNSWRASLLGGLPPLFPSANY